MGEVPWIRMVGRERRLYDPESHPQEWLRECVEPIDGLGSSLAMARSSFMDFLVANDIDHKTGDRNDGKKLLRSLGYRTGRADGVTRFRGVVIGWWGEREEDQGDPGGPMEVLGALGALTRAGLITKETSRKAWEAYDGDTGPDDD